MSFFNHLDKEINPHWLRFLAISIGTVSLLTLNIIADNSSEATIWMHRLLPFGSMAFFLYTLYPGPLRTWRHLLYASLVPLLGVVLSLFVERRHPGGDYFHYWLGFPVRWLTADVVYGSRETYWGLYLLGLAGDYLFWLHVAAILFLPLWLVNLVWRAYHRIAALAVENQR